MKRDYSALVLPAIALTGCLLVGYLAIFRPDYLDNQYLAALAFCQLMVAIVWKYDERFFPLFMLVFLWAGTTLPLHEAWLSGRWAVLAVGSVAGLAVYLRDRDHHFGLIHLLAFFCATAAVVSAVSSAHPGQALLKAVSLMLLFLYGAAGARVAIARKPQQFFRGLLLCCEVLTYCSAVAYLVLHLEIFGSSNSLGAVMGVAAVPLLLWGVVVEGRRDVRVRRTLALILAVFLLFFSVARAGIVAGPVTCIVLCIALRRYRVLVKGVLLAVVLATIAAAFVPYQTDESSSATSLFLYKGHRAEGILGSRKTPWEQTLAVIKENPWFGSGFGTSTTSASRPGPSYSFATNPQTLREHGNSYLAMIEWMGLLGVLPFCALLIVIVTYVVRIFREVRQHGNACHAAIPIAMVLTAGLIHALFEDWLFAPGYYLCVFFWTLAFNLEDFVPKPAAAAIRRTLPRFSSGYATFAAHR